MDPIEIVFEFGCLLLGLVEKVAFLIL